MNLKGLAILALAFNILPVKAYAQTNKTQQTYKADKPSAPVARVVPQNINSPSLQTESNNHVEADVRVVKTPEKDGWDKAAFWINAALAFAGIVGVTIGVCTLWLIRAQLTEMRTQATLMAGQLAEMQKAREIENKTLILQYRPRILIRNTVAKSFSTEIGAEGKCSLSFQIVNIGGSTARIVGGAMYLLSITATSVEDMQFVHGEEGAFKQRTLEPGERENFEDTLSANTVGDAEWVRFHQGDKSHYSIYLQGTIWYRDDLNIPRQTGISRKYDPEKRRFVPVKDSEEEYSD